MVSTIIPVLLTTRLLAAQTQFTQESASQQGPVCQTAGQWYPAGSIINMGRSDNWCYGSYCAIDGTVKYWDDYNCPLPTAQNPRPEIPENVKNEINQIKSPQTGVSQNQPSSGKQQNLFQTQMFGAKPLFPPEQITPPPLPTTEANFFDSYGCWYRGRFFWPGTDIYNTRNGFRCVGAYCDWQSKVQHWEDTCRATVPPPPRRPVDRT